MSSLENKLDFWIKNNFNVLLRGRHGTGKSSLVIDAFNKAGLKWLYFSAATLDTYVDFVGVPKEAKDENGNSYLDLIRPKYMQEDGVEAIFLDEFNRGSKKIKNSVMELIQFRSINGHKFNKLKCIFAAINPEDDEDQTYDVEPLDPAQKDRFHVIVDVPYLPSVSYFKEKYGQDISESAITWWKELTNDIKKDISPRRLDYALDMYKKGGDLRDVIPAKANINKLLIELETGSISKKMKKLFDDNAAEDAKKFLTIENNYSACIEYIVKNNKYLQFFLPLLSDEKIASLIYKHPSVENYVFDNHLSFEPLLRELMKSNTNYQLSKKLNKLFKPKPINMKQVFLLAQDKVVIAGVRHHYTSTPAQTYTAILGQIASMKKTYASGSNSTTQRTRMYSLIEQYIPLTMPLDECNKTIDCLSDILRRSQSSTIKTKMKKIIHIMNHAIYVLAGHGIAPSFDRRVLIELNSYPEFIYNVCNDKSHFTAKPTAQQAVPITSAYPIDTAFGPRQW